MPRLRKLFLLAVSLVVLATACSSSDSDPASSGENPDTGSESEDGSDPVTVTLNAGNLLSATVEMSTAEETSLTVVAVDDDGHRVEMPPGPEGTEHALPLLGLRPDRNYTVELSAAGETVGTGEVRSGSLPAGFPDVTLGENDPDRIAEGLTLISAIPLTFPDPDAPEEEDPEPVDAGFIMMVDSEGEVVWYHGPLEQPVIGVEVTPDNTLLFSYNHMTFREIDLLGNTVGEWVGTVGYEKLVADEFDRPYFSEDAIPIDAESLHHEIEYLPGGTVLTLSTELAEIQSDEQLCVDAIDDGDGVYPVVSDTVVELDLTAGTVVGEWPLFSALDPNADPAASRVCDHPPNAALVPNFMYPEVEGDPYDWTHGNAVVLDEPNNVLIVSARHLDALLGIRYQDDSDGPAGEVVWSLGPGGDFELVEGEWWSYQHSPEIQTDGTLLLYDNGNRRPDAPAEVAPGTLPPDEDFEVDPENPPYSRAVLIEYDTVDGTVNQLWEHIYEVDGQPIYAGIVGDSDRLANGNVLIVHGFSTEGAFVLEVEPEGSSGGDLVMELAIPEGYVVYRAERIPTLSALVADAAQ